MSAVDKAGVLKIEDNQSAQPGRQRQPWHAPKLMRERVSEMTWSHAGKSSDIHSSKSQLS